MGFQNAYWAREEQGIWVGASLRIGQRSLAREPELAMEHLSEYLSFRYTHAPRTLYKDRFSLIAGHFSIVGQESS